MHPNEGSPPHLPVPDRKSLVPGLAGRLVVSCQALPGEPLHGPVHMSAMARSAVMGGAAAVRVNGPEDVAAVRGAVRVPVIGLWKDGEEGVYITPTLRHALAVAEAGADIVALDATGRPRGDGLDIAATFAALHAAGVLVMADVSTLDEGLAAAAAGADLVATTLSGYTGTGAPRSAAAGPDLDLVASLAARTGTPVAAEGRITTPEQAAAVLAAGAHCVVVGGAITRPADLTRRFVTALTAPRTESPA
ncbi:N-acetylmannosamine-6-phosphate 2-epimerase [Streptomyces sp. NPDC020983]|uniref:N-acetylmannosamine-6-phosphate 2-epimerase n=1 Tax=Streptomyces sp. NPDC020983 TaxID=3365106 RepID=UPI00379B4505